MSPRTPRLTISSAREARRFQHVTTGILIALAAILLLGGANVAAGHTSPLTWISLMGLLLTLAVYLEACVRRWRREQIERDLAAGESHTDAL